VDARAQPPPCAPGGGRRRLRGGGGERGGDADGGEQDGCEGGGLLGGEGVEGGLLSAPLDEEGDEEADCVVCGGGWVEGETRARGGVGASRSA